MSRKFYNNQLHSKQAFLFETLQPTDHIMIIKGKIFKLKTCTHIMFKTLFALLIVLRYRYKLYCLYDYITSWLHVYTMLSKLSSSRFIKIFRDLLSHLLTQSTANNTTKAISYKSNIKLCMSQSKFLLLTESLLDTTVNL